MQEALPVDMEEYVEQKVTTGAFASREEVVAAAVRLYREVEARRDHLTAEVRAALDQSDQGLSEPLDIEAVKRELAHELDVQGRSR